MPFTLAHPATVAPFRRLIGPDRLPFEAFVIGTMSPDFEYLFRLEPFALISHESYGLFLFGVPIGLIAVALWVFLLRDPTRALFALPVTKATRPHSFRWWVRAAAAVLIGGATHVVWDAFTHRDAWGPVLIPSLKHTAFSVGTVHVPWYNVLQLLSSIAGGTVVLMWLWGRMQHAHAWPAVVTEPWRRRTWVALILFATLFGAWNATQQGLMVDSSSTTRTTIILGRFAVGGLTGFSIALTLYSLLYFRKARRK